MITKKILTGLIILSLFSGCTSSGKIKNNQSVSKSNKSIIIKQTFNRTYNRLDADNLFSKTVINVREGEIKHYLYGNNVSGFSDIYSSSYNKGELFNIFGCSVVSDFFTIAEDTINNRKTGRSNFYLSGSETLFKNGCSELFSLLTAKNGFSITVKSRESKKLGIIPQLNINKGNVDYIIKDGILLFHDKSKNKEYPAYVAVIFDKNIEYNENYSYNDKNFIKDITINNNFLSPSFITKENQKELTALFFYGKTEEEVISKAVDSSKYDVIKDTKIKLYDILMKSYLLTSDEEYNKSMMWSKLYLDNMETNLESNENINNQIPLTKNMIVSLPGRFLFTNKSKNMKSIINTLLTYQNKGDLFIECEYNDDSTKNIVAEYLKKNFISRLENKDGKILIQLLPNAMENLPAIEKKIEEMNKFEGIKARGYISINKNYGLIPSSISKEIKYDSPESTLWLMREIMEYIKYSNDVEFEKQVFPFIKFSLTQIKKNFCDEYNFIIENDSTLKSVNISSINRSAYMQALWYVALQSGANIALANGDTENRELWLSYAENLKNNFKQMFWDYDKKLLSSGLTKDNLKIFQLTFNPYLLISLPLDKSLIHNEAEARIIKRDFHNSISPFPVDVNINTDIASYNSKSVLSQSYIISALNKYGYSDISYKLTQFIAAQLLETPIDVLSIAAFNRNNYQDYLGISPELPNNIINFAPKIPAKWQYFKSVVTLGNGIRFHSSMRIEGKNKIYSVSADGLKDKITVNMTDFGVNKEAYSISFELSNNHEKEIVFNIYDHSFKIGNTIIIGNLSRESYIDAIGDIPLFYPKIGQ